MLLYKKILVVLSKKGIWDLIIKWLWQRVVIKLKYFDDLEKNSENLIRFQEKLIRPLKI